MPILEGCGVTGPGEAGMFGSDGAHLAEIKVFGDGLSKAVITTFYQDLGIESSTQSNYDAVLGRVSHQIEYNNDVDITGSSRSTQDYNQFENRIEDYITGSITTVAQTPIYARRTAPSIRDRSTDGTNTTVIEMAPDVTTISAEDGTNSSNLGVSTLQTSLAVVDGTNTGSLHVKPNQVLSKIVYGQLESGIDIDPNGDLNGSVFYSKDVITGDFSEIRVNPYEADIFTGDGTNTGGFRFHSDQMEITISDDTNQSIIDQTPDGLRTTIQGVDAVISDQITGVDGYIEHKSISTAFNTFQKITPFQVSVVASDDIDNQSVHVISPTEIFENVVLDSGDKSYGFIIGGAIDGMEIESTNVNYQANLTVVPALIEQRVTTTDGSTTVMQAEVGNIAWTLSDVPNTKATTFGATPERFDIGTGLFEVVTTDNALNTTLTITPALNVVTTTNGDISETFSLDPTVSGEGTSWKSFNSTTGNLSSIANGHADGLVITHQDTDAGLAGTIVVNNTNVTTTTTDGTNTTAVTQTPASHQISIDSPDAFLAYQATTIPSGGTSQARFSLDPNGVADGTLWESSDGANTTVVALSPTSATTTVTGALANSSIVQGSDNITATAEEFFIYTGANSFELTDTYALIQNPLIQLDGAVIFGTANYADNATTSALTKSNLNSTYSTAHRGFKVFALSIIGGGEIYEKIGGTDWISTSASTVV